MSFWEKITGRELNRESKSCRLIGSAIEQTKPVLLMEQEDED